MLTVHKRSRLPHWDTTAPCFVTFNLFDAMPREVVERLEGERHFRIAELEKLKGKSTQAELHAIERLIRERSEESLDQGAGSCFMKEPHVAEIVANSMTHFDGDRYALFSWSVMPNHAHAVLKSDGPLDRVIQSWKSFSSKAANRFLHRSGKFWQDD